MKRPIEASEIRAGDLVRWEWDTVAKSGPHAGSKAIEFVAEADHYDRRGSGKYYLLDRPEPTVELPTEPTLGRLTWYAGEESSGLGIVRALIDVFEPSELGVTNDFSLGEYPAASIVSFEPMTAVPTEALDSMRRVAATCDATYPDYKEAVFTFLAAIDAANGGAA